MIVHRRRAGLEVGVPDELAVQCHGHNSYERQSGRGEQEVHGRLPEWQYASLLNDVLCICLGVSKLRAKVQAIAHLHEMSASSKIFAD